MWTVGPMVIYIIERIVRFIRSQQRVVITKVSKKGEIIKTVIDFRDIFLLKYYCSIGICLAGLS
jgi:hypothetical protein